MSFRQILPCALLLATSPAIGQPVAVAPFKSIESRNGALVTVRFGPTQRVEILGGSPSVTVNGQGRLTIDNPGHSHKVRTSVAIVTPRVEALAVAEGGRMTVEAGFPRHGAVAAAVTNGGRLDLRRLPVEQVSASVSQGGMIAVRPARQLSAAVSQGGNVTYWGEPAVTRSINRHGVVMRGKPEDMETPL